MKYFNENEIELTDIHDIQVTDHTRPGMLERLFTWVRGEEPSSQIDNNPMPERVLTRKQRMQIKDALQKWKDAVAYFENVEDPELVEYAVYEIEAAKRRYIFLLKNSHMI